MSDVIKAVTDQFALINADSDADLRAVGAALCQIPEGMSPLSADNGDIPSGIWHSAAPTARKSASLSALISAN